MKLNNILIINTFGIGDVLFSTPLIKEIKRNQPRSNIYFICNKRNLDLLKNDPDISGILVFEKDDFREVFKESKIEFLKKLFEFIRKIKNINPDVAIDLTLNYQMSIILILAGVRMRVGFNYKNRGKFLTHKMLLSGFDTKPVALYYLDLLKFLGLTISERPKLWAYTSEENRQVVNNFLEEKELSGNTLIGIAAGGGKSWGKNAVYRRWDSDNFAYVGQRLSEMNNVRILVFGTAEEKDICNRICEKIGENAISLCGRTSLDLLIEFISRCKLIICNEGGLLHIAVSSNVNTISIFGPVNDKVYGPYPLLDKHKVIKAENIKCRPCYMNFKHKTCETHDCLKEIDRDRVLKVAKESILQVHSPRSTDHRL